MDQDQNTNNADMSSFMKELDERFVVFRSEVLDQVHSEFHDWQQHIVKALSEEDNNSVVAHNGKILLHEEVIYDNVPISEIEHHGRLVSQA